MTENVPSLKLKLPRKKPPPKSAADSSKLVAISNRDNKEGKGDSSRERKTSSSITGSRIEELENQAGETEIVFKEAKFRADQIYVDRENDIKGYYKNLVESLQKELFKAWAVKTRREAKVNREVSLLQESQHKIKTVEGNSSVNNKHITTLKLRMK